MHKQFKNDKEAKDGGLKIGDIYQIGPNYECSDELATMLENLRNAQKGFFRSKVGTLERQIAFDLSRTHEKELDAFLLRRKAEKADTQTKLF